MPALDEKSYAEFNRILEELAPEIDNMKETPQSFVRDIIDKNKLYGERVYVSPKQLAWLQKLHEEYVGNIAFDKGDDGDGPDPNDPRFQ